MVYTDCGPVLSLEQAKLWAKTLFVMCFTVLFQKVNAEHYRPITFAFIGISLLIHFCADRRKINGLWWSVFSFMVLFDVMYLQMACIKETPSVHLYMDLPTQLTTTLPGLLLLNLRGAPLFFLLVFNIGACAAFYHTVAKHCVLLAIIRAASIQAVCSYAYLRIKRVSERRTSCAAKRACRSYGEKVDPSQDKHALTSPLSQKQFQQQAQASAAQLPQQGHEAQQHTEGDGHGAQQQLDGLTASAACQMPGRLSLSAGEEVAPGPVALAASAACMSGNAAAVNELGDSNKGGTAAARIPCILGTKELLLSAQKQQQHQHQQGACMMRGVLGLKRQAETSERSSSSSGGSSNHSSLPQNLLQQTRGPQQALSASKISAADVQKVLTEGARARAQRPRLQYVSKLARIDCSHSSSTMEYLQQACRFAVKINGPTMPEQLSSSAAAQLKHRLSRYQRLMHAEPTAVRAGCLVISYGAVPYNLAKSVSLEELSLDVAAITREWALEYGILSSEGTSLSFQDNLHVQACKQAWGSSSSACREATSPEFSMGLRMPFLLPDLPCPTPVPANLHEQQVCTEAQPSLIAIYQSEMSCCFEMVLVAPPHFEVRGWHGAADAPEDLANDIKNCSVCLLASLGGHFVSVAVEQRSSSSSGERVLQVRVGLPVSMLSASTHCPGVLVLELWAAGSLVCSHSALLLSSCYSGAFAELQDWSASQASSCQAVQDQAAHCHLPVESTAFMEDLVCWMCFQASTNSAQQQQQHLHNESAAVRSNTADTVVDEQELALMADVGQDLLRHCMECGMVAVAGLLAEGLVSPPFCLLPALLGSQVPEVGQADLPHHHYQSEAGGVVALESTSHQAPQEAGSSTVPKAQAAALSLWAAAVSGCVQGFGTQAANRACSSSTSQQQHVEPAHPTEAGFKEWGASFSSHVTNIRFICCGSLVISAPFAAFLGSSGGATEILNVAILTLNTLPYIIWYQQSKVALKIAKYIHFFVWTLMGLGIYLAINRRTKNMLDYNFEVLVLVLFLSPFPDQVSLHTLLRERALTTAVFALLFRGLNTYRPLLRSLLVNFAAFSIEASLGVYLRWLYLRHVKEQQIWQQLQLQEKKL